MALPRRELIRGALQERSDELWFKRIAELVPAEFTEASAFVTALQAQKSPSAGEASLLAHQTTANGWMERDGDCFEALRRLSLGEELPARVKNAPAVEPFMASLQSARRVPAERFRLLVERYSFPPNIALDAEHDVREHLLERLMVQDRARLESDSIAAVDSDDLLLKLNLAAIYAAHSTDLRYLDALNYYYELWPERWQMQGERAPLLFISFLGLYARALSAWLKAKLSE